jgi:hypothetical protein
VSVRSARIQYDAEIAARFPTTLVRGRSPADGYLRGVGLEFSADVVEQIEAHPLYKEAFRAAQGRTVMSVDRLRNLFLIVVNHLGSLERQDVIEFGSYRGGSVAFLGVLLKELYPHASVYGLDTFDGMPVVSPSVDFHASGDFGDTSVAAVQDHLDRLALHNVILVKGRVENTFPLPCAKPRRAFGLAHIDLDLYEPIKHVQRRLWSRMVAGGYVVYDDATVSTCLGATQAVEELIQSRKLHCEQIYPHFVFRCGTKAEPLWRRVLKSLERAKAERHS